jgi:HSP20 family molecular chaperone IbpA
MHKGLDGLVRGLGDLLQIASDVAERTERGAANGVFGVSVRVGHGPVASRVEPLSRHARTASVDGRDAVADLFDEEDHYLIVAEFPGVAESGVQWSIRGDRAVLLRATAPNGRTYAREIALSCCVDAGTAAARYGNGVLELRVWKQQPR